MDPLPFRFGFPSSKGLDGIEMVGKTQIFSITVHLDLTERTLDPFDLGDLLCFALLC